jgi:hypothetical protein
MAICDFAQVEILSSSTSHPYLNPLQVIYHSAVSTANDLHGYFSGTNVYSHFYINHDGTLFQYCDTNREAYAQYAGNHTGISCESEDGGDPDNNKWNAAQIATMIKLSQWANRIHGIPFNIAPAHDQPGQAYHRLFPQWNKDYHSCPGNIRVDQFNNEFLPKLANPVTPTPQPEDDEMQFIVKGDKDTKWYITDFKTKTHVPSVDFAKAVIWLTAVAGGKIGQDGNNGPIPVAQAIIDAVPLNS